MQSLEFIPAVSFIHKNGNCIVWSGRVAKMQEAI